MRKDNNVEKPVHLLILIDFLGLIVLVIEFIYFTVSAIKYKGFHHSKTALVWTSNLTYLIVFIVLISLRSILCLRAEIYSFAHYDTFINIKHNI